MNKVMQTIPAALGFAVVVLVIVAAVVGPAFAGGAGEEADSDAMDVEPAGERVVHPEDADLAYPVTLSDAVWRELLEPDAYDILRQKGTEPAFSHPLNDNTQAGIYYSRATGQPLFRSEDKYDSGSGWPSFTRPTDPNAVVYIEDNSLFSRRIEVVDSLSGSHLGHVFADGPEPTGQRYCINGTALIFVPYGEDPPPVRTGPR